jgi:hypothetical protein
MRLREVAMRDPAGREPWEQKLIYEASHPKLARAHARAQDREYADGSVPDMGAGNDIASDYSPRA